MIIVLILIGTAAGYYLKSGSFAAQSETTLALTIHYEDGSTRTIDPSANPIFPQLAVLDDTGKPFRELTFLTKISVAYEGTAISANIQGTVDIFVNDGKKDSVPFKYTSVPASEKWITVMTGSLSASILEDWGKAGENTLRIVAPTTVTMSFADGNSDQKTGMGGVVMTYNVDAAAPPAGSQISAIQIKVSPSLLY